jgi:hypothetical protein
VISNGVAITVDRPAYMVVQQDFLGQCDGCSSTVVRLVTYQVTNYSGTPAGAVPVCETPTLTNWSCNQAQGPTSVQVCTGSPYTTNPDGTFTDGWSLASDVYTPIGCGFDIVDKWFYAPSPTVQKPIGTLTGYVHTDAVSINGVVNPPNTLPVGTVINP